MIEVTLRPIADAIARVRIVPLAPTSVPATSSSTLPSTSPDAATVSPVNAFSSEMTIGTSAPPTGSTSSTPATRPSTSSTSTRDERVPVATTKPPLARAPASTSPMTIGWPGNVIGRVGISSCSFANVMHEPENETAPTSTVNAIARSGPRASRSAAARAARPARPHRRRRR